MGTLMDNNSAESVGLIERARAGDREALNALLARHRDRLRRMVEIRVDTRLQARLDASDVIQEAYVDVAERLEEYLLPRQVLLDLTPRWNNSWISSCIDAAERAFVGGPAS
jgi:hypothetical protein